MESLSRREALARLYASAAAGLGAALSACGSGARKRLRQTSLPPGFVATDARAGTLPVRSWQSAIWGAGRTASVVYLRRSDTGAIVALSSRCPHLACPVHYVPEVRKFICPCHGGVFGFDGSVEGGPPPRGMTHLDVVVRDGRVYLAATASVPA